MAHEVGHWLGLRHTSERTGKTFDYIKDTPECPAHRDHNGDGRVDQAECAGAGAEEFDVSGSMTSTRRLQW